MPTPNENENQEDFIARCVPVVKEEDAEVSDEEANAVCQLIWDKESEDTDEENEEPVEAAFSHSGLPCELVAGRTFMKDIMRVGKYVHDDGEEVEVTASHLKNWVIQFKEMKKNGVKVPCPIGHNDEASKNAGWVDNIIQVDDTLYASIKLGKGKDRLVDTTDVSIFAPKVFKDGRGVSYHNPIAHVALVSTPLVPGLGEFVEIAASRIPIYNYNNIEEEVEVEKEVVEKEKEVVAQLDALKIEIKEIKNNLRDALIASRKGCKTGIQTLGSPIANDDSIRQMAINIAKNVK